jgi:GAF domain-containing protein
VLDRIEFGLEPGSELEVKTTICDEIRQSGQEVFIDHVDGDLAWRRHPVPILYGFQSYVSLPLFRADGSFYGTLCAIDPEPRQITGSETLATMRALAVQLSTVLSAENSATSPG